ncbi:MAG TPA: SpoIIE family protein phosphatase [Spirochaetota bacterium]|nr:SpoIIE family protein phosphatase [Spirochaetota bacterium]
MPASSAKNSEKRSVLIIDDSKLNRAVVRNTLSKLDMEVAEARDGIEGLEILGRRRFDLVLVDNIMPNLDGFGFIERFKKKIGNEFIPVILMTGSEDLNTKIAGLNIGADDYLIKPLNENELSARVNSLLRLKKTHDELYKKNLLVKKELDIARRVQQFIIPRDFSCISYPSISGRYLPIEDIGGDFFDCYRLGDDTGILIADVTGHGIPAAMVMTMSKMMFGLYAAQIDSPGVLLSRVNNELRKLILDNQYITAFYIIYDARRRQLRFTNAGHARPLYYRRSSGRMLALDTDGLFVGIKDGAEYQEKTLNIEEGDRLLLYTDGITELKNSRREEFGEKRLARFIIDNSGETGAAFCDDLLSEIRFFSGGEPPDDDIAFLYVEF